MANNSMKKIGDGYGFIVDEGIDKLYVIDRCETSY